MNDAAEASSRAQASDHDVPVVDDNDGGLDLQEQRRFEKELRLETKRKRIRMLSALLTELDIMVYMHLIATYHFDCSFFWLVVKTLIHGSLLTPVSDTTVSRPPIEPQPFLPILLFYFCVNFLLHTTYPAPSAGEETRGYLHGGLMIDFIGQQGPTSKWRLAALDLCVLFLQLVMVSVHVKRRELKKKLSKLSAEGEASTSTTTDAATASADTTQESTAQTMQDNAARDQDTDHEERGILHRTDTLSDAGANDDEEEDALLNTSDGSLPAGLELLNSGQCVIGDFTLIDTLVQENRNYSAYRLTRSESGINDMPETLRRLHTLRTRFGVGGG